MGRHASRDQPTSGSNADYLDGHDSTYFQSVGNVRVVTATTTEIADDRLIVCNKATSMTVNLLAASGSKRIIEIANINNGAVTVDGNSGDTIDGELTQVLGNGDCMNIKDYAANKWVII
jgi:hypothetical protein